MNIDIRGGCVAGMAEDLLQDFRPDAGGNHHSREGVTADMIFMDIMMPKVNGYEATKAIRDLPDRPDARTIPIIAMTANAFAEDVQASLDAGMNGHIAKPIVMEEVIKAIAQNLGSHIH